ncbi:MAG TPA: hypothetical protein VFB45_26130 [Pseudolabrys sp.]|nr:hypothetical protein [Pseudolabrys sp.]
MAVLLFVIGGLSVVAGAALTAFGFSIELSFGNSLIVAGVTALVGGFIIIGLGAAVAQLRRIAELLGRSDLPRPLEDGRPPAARVQFPPRPKGEAKAAAAPRELTIPLRLDEVPTRTASTFAPTPADLHTGGEESDEVPLSPLTPPRAPSAPSAKPAETKPATPPLPEPPWRTSPGLPPSRPLFDTLWPAERPAKAGPNAKLETNETTAKAPPREPAAEPVGSPPDASEAEAMPARETRAVAILKSGVVDGMGYTLYVDGSIEAELPQGTLRFNSIGELRHHLEKNS